MPVSIASRADIPRAAIAQQVSTYRSGRAVARDMARRYDALIKDLEADLVRINPGGVVRRSARTVRLNELNAAITKRLDAYARETAAMLAEPYAAALLESAGFSSEIVNKALGGDVLKALGAGHADIKTLLNNRVIKGVSDADFWTAHSNAIRSKFLEATRLGISNNLKPTEIMAMPQMTRQLGAVRHQLQSYGETTVATAANEGMSIMYERASQVGIVDGVEHVAVLDTRTCKTCGPMDGRVWAYVDRTWTGRGHQLAYGPPPANTHYRCRCMLLPTLVNWDELPADIRDQVPPAMRSAVGGPVSAGKTHAEWLNALTQAETDKIFGQKLGRKLKTGKTNLDKALTDDDFADDLPTLK